MSCVTAHPQGAETLYLSAILVAERQYGVAAMSTGKRRAMFLRRLEREVVPALAGRILPFDLDASGAYAY